MAGTSPAVLLALTAAATSTIRIGSGAVQMGHRTALSTVEEFGLIDALHPGRLDLGLPPRFSVKHLLGSPRFQLQKALLQRPTTTSARRP